MAFPARPFFSSSRLTAYTTTVLLLASVVVNVVQASKLGAFTPSAPAGPVPGSAAPRLEAKTLDGQPREISFIEQPTILYYFSPNCGWCEKNWLNVKALVASTEGRYRFIGLSTTPDVSSFVRGHRLTFDVYSGLSLETARQYHFGPTPYTVVVSGDGTIEAAWGGAYVGPRQRSVERYFGLTLPGLVQTAPVE